MGMHIGFSQSSYDRCNCGCHQVCQQAVPQNNPNPKNYIILGSEQIGNFLIAAVKYPDCSNYEGRKVLVFSGVTIDKLLAQGSIDPHFSENKKYISPVARFEPSARGLLMARKLCVLLETENV